MRWVIHRVDETGSTNADVREMSRAGHPEGTVEVADFQAAGRGRLDRGWTSPRGKGLTLSMLLRPGANWAVPTNRWTWLPILAGIAVVDAIAMFTEATGVEARLKWPNDVLIDEHKVCGILTEVVQPLGGVGPAAAVTGIGLNVTTSVDELPAPTSTSLAIATGQCIDREVVLAAVLETFGHWYERWCAAHGDADASGLREAYRNRSATLGRMVRVQTAADTYVEGRALDVNAEACLELETPHGRRTFGSGDVIHATLR